MILSIDNDFHIQDQIVAATSYYGFMDAYGHWYIMKSVDAGAGEINYSYASAANNSGASYDWSARAGLTYGTYGEAF